MAIGVDVQRAGPLLVGDPTGRVDDLSTSRVAEAARVYRDAARRRAPHRSGELAASIEVEGTGKEVLIQATARHAPYVEYGFRHGRTFVAPRQFFYDPSNETAAQNILEKLPEDIANELG